jgi:hypothetical protein
MATANADTAGGNTTDANLTHDREWKKLWSAPAKHRVVATTFQSQS